MRTLFWKLRLFAKACVTACGFGDWMIESCERCGIRQPLYWWASNDLWLELTGNATPQGDNAAGILCPKCFDDLATARGYILQWVPRKVHD